MRLPPFALSTALLAAVLPGQFARAPQQIDAPGVDSYSPVIASAGDLTAVAYVDSGDGSVRLAVSDGRGVEWGSPLRVDELLTVRGLPGLKLLVLGERAYVAWIDHRNGSNRAEVFMNIYDASTGAFLGERWVDKGQLQGTGFVSDFAMAVAEDAGACRVHFLLHASMSGAIDDLLLVTTTDDGASFSAPKNLTPSRSQVSFLRFDLAAEGSNLHIVWVDDRADPTLSIGRQLFYQRSTDGGVTFLDEDVVLDANGPESGVVRSGLDLEISPSCVAVAWVEQQPSPSAGTDRLHVNVSSDGGSTFAGDQVVGQYLLTDTWISSPRLSIEPDSGNVIVGWGDYRGGNPSTAPLQSFVATTVDGGVSWLPDVQLSPVAGLGVGMVHTTHHTVDGTAEVTVTWTDGLGGKAGTMASHSRDGGVTWEPALRLSDDLPGLQFAYNHRYGNYVAMWMSTNQYGGMPFDVFVGGFRPQSVVPAEGTAGAPMHFRLRGFSGESAAAGVLLSFAPGSALLGGRNLGLAFDPLFAISASLFTTVLGVRLGPAGGGITLPWSAALPPGLEFYAVAVSMQPRDSRLVGEPTRRGHRGSGRDVPGWWPDEITDVVPVVAR